MKKNFGGQVSETRTILHFGFKHKLESGENIEQKVFLYLDHWQMCFHYRGEVMAKYDTAPYLVGRGVLVACSWARVFPLNWEGRAPFSEAAEEGRG